MTSRRTIPDVASRRPVTAPRPSVSRDRRAKRPHGMRLLFTVLLAVGLSSITSSLPAAEGTGDDAYRVTSLEEITPGIFPQWSPDGREIAFTRQENETFEIYLMKPDGSNQRCLTCDKQALPEGGFRGQPAWHPGGRYLCFGAENTDYPRKGKGGTARPGIGRNNNIWIMNRSGTRFWRMTDYPENWGVMRCSFSHDGSKLFWNEEFSMEKYPDGPNPGHQWGWSDAWRQKGEELGAWRATWADLDLGPGGPSISNIRHLDPPEGFTLLESSGFTPDDQGIIFSYTDLSLTDNGRALFGDIYISDLDGNSLRRMTFTVKTHDENAVFSPDGTRIAWNHSPGTGRSGLPGRAEELFLMNADGTGETRLTGFWDESEPEYDPDSRQISDIGWSPDGRHLVFGHASRKRHRSWDIGSSVWILTFGDGPGRPAPGRARQPGQPAGGPGGRDYTHASVTKSRHGEDGAEFWLFEPAEPTPASAPVIVFNHGWGAMTPDSYGAWIEHLVRRGNIVVYPRYQAGLLTMPGKFTSNAIEATKNALRLLRKRGHVSPDGKRFAIVGHSAGGVVSANMAAEAAAAGLPRPSALMIMHPGEVGGKRSGMALRDLGNIPASTLVVVVVGADDKLVGDGDAKRLFSSLSHLRRQNRNYLIMVSDNHGDPPVVADHLGPLAASEAYADEKRRWRRRSRSKKLDSSVDALDFYGYWKLLDGLSDAAFYGRNREFALGAAVEVRRMGMWSDGKPIKQLIVVERP
jgi:dipeptidyl aminopeptidase/acylaminoacyl peptidase